MNKPPRIFLLSQGCTANFGEGEQMAGLLQAQGYTVSEDAAIPPDAGLLNVCTVKGNGTALKAIRAARTQHPDMPMLITGCVTPDLVRDLQRMGPGISIASTNALDHIPDLLNRTLHGESVTDLTRTHAPKVGLPKHRRNPVIGIVSISNGCLDACTFCSTRLVKGQLQSYPVESIVNEVRELVADGCQEIWMAGQDASCYGFDIGTNLARLVQAILIKVSGKYHIRLGMGNPRHLLSYAEELVETYHDPRIFRFMHLPVQSGSDSVLARMKRQHSVADYYRLVEIFRGNFPDLTLSTDLIVGFPGETPEDFAQTLRLVRDTRPSSCNRTRFVPRPGTLAAKLDQAVHNDEKRARSAELTDVFMRVAQANNEEWIGKTTHMVIYEAGKRGSWIGHNDCYRPIAVHGDFSIGTHLDVRIDDAEPFALLAHPLPR